VSGLPWGWVAGTLGDFVEPVRVGIDPASVPGFPYLGLEHVQAQTTNILGSALASSVRSTSYEFAPGATLFARLRPYLNKVCTPTFEGIGSGEFIIFPACAHLAPSFLKYLLNQPAFVEFTSTLDTGDRPRVNWNGIKNFSCALPPLAEQKRIVATIEEQFSRLDAGMTPLERVRLNLKRMRAALLHQAIGGPALRKYERSPFGEVLREPLRNGHSAKADPLGTVPVFTLTAVTLGDFSDRNIKMTAADPRRIRDLWIQPGDILIERSNTRELVGTTRLYRGRSRAAVYPDLIIRARVKDSVLPEYAELVLQSPDSRRYFQQCAQGISGTMPKIDQGVIERLPFPVPSKRMQAAIVADAERWATVLDVLEGELSLAENRLTSLRLSILAAAFSGRLVPQDPDDEPAVVLLERIRTRRGSDDRKPAKSQGRRRRKLAA
jgi:type I restriction enzyme S subunit